MLRVMCWPRHVTGAFFIFSPCITIHLDKADNMEIISQA
jgi:hypothetical protein